MTGCTYGSQISEECPLDVFGTDNKNNESEGSEACVGLALGLLTVSMRPAHTTVIK